MCPSMSFLCQEWHVGKKKWLIYFMLSFMGLLKWYTWKIQLCVCNFPPVPLSSLPTVFSWTCARMESLSLLSYFPTFPTANNYTALDTVLEERSLVLLLLLCMPRSGDPSWILKRRRVYKFGQRLISFSSKSYWMKFIFKKILKNKLNSEMFRFFSFFFLFLQLF